MAASKRSPPPLPPPRPGSPRARAAQELSKPVKKAEAKAEPEPPRRAAKPAREPAPARPPRAPRPAFPKKNQPPTPPAFTAQLPLALGKRFDLVRAFLLKQKGVSEDVYFYGPESGWALRYLHDDKPLCSLHIHDQQPMGIISLEAAASEKLDWKALSPIGRRARQQAHGSPSLLWLDVALDADGAADFRSMLRAKLATLTEGRPHSAQV